MIMILAYLLGQCTDLDLCPVIPNLFFMRTEAALFLSLYFSARWIFTSAGSDKEDLLYLGTGAQVFSLQFPYFLLH